MIFESAREDWEQPVAANENRRPPTAWRAAARGTGETMKYRPMQYTTDRRMPLGMPAADRRRWAKELLIEAIDDAVSNYYSDRGVDLDWDERDELRRQRNRVARMFGMKETPP